MKHSCLPAPRTSVNGGRDTTMTADKFCPICKNKNTIDDAKCAYCGAPFREGSDEPITTVPVVGAQPDLIIKSSQHLQELAKYPADALVLFIMDDEEPLVIAGANKVVLGRNVSNIPPVVFDLSNYGASELGVSRQHAMITRSNNSYTLTDLGSTNGTWLNASRLIAQKPYPLRSGDQVRLGNLRMFVYFRAGEEAHGAIEEIILLAEEPRASSAMHPRVTARYLSTTIYPYVQALVELQNVVEECQGQPPREIIINTISAMRPDLPIGISITGASHAISLAKQMIAPWRKLRAGAPDAAAPPANPPDEPQGAYATRIISQAEPGGIADTPLTPTQQADLLRLAQDIINNVAPGLPLADKSTFVARAMPAISVLATSRLQISLDKSNPARP